MPATPSAQTPSRRSATPARGAAARIREARLARGLRQAHVARAAGISPSYLALIEGGRRPIGGTLLGRIAEAIGVERAALAREEDAALLEALDAAADGLPPDARAAAPDLARRFPDWAALVARQAAQAARDRDRLAALSDRLTHDPALADAMHELLTTVASVRSTAAILAQTEGLERAWLDRFHANLDAESRRLASGAEAVVSYFDRAAEAAGAAQTPAETAAAFLESRRFPEVEDPAADLDALAAELLPPARALVRAALARDAADARAMPDPAPDEPPTATAARTGQPVARVLRRRAAVDPARGLAVCDAAGALIRRRPVAGFALPVVGAGCPLWPLYTAFARPLHPVAAELRAPDGGLWRADACAEAVAVTPHGPVLEATMLLTRLPEARDPLDVGPGCRVCPRPECPARREPALVALHDAGQAPPQT